MGTRRSTSSIGVLLAACLLIRQLQRLLQLNRTLSLLSLGEHSVQQVEQVAIPCFEESHVASGSARFFGETTAEVGVTFLTAAAENGQATARALRAQQADVVVVPGADHSKGALLNAFARTARIPFAIYDIDSEPTAFPTRPRKKNEVVQQLSLYRPKSNESAFWRGFGLNQTRWAFTFEANNWRRRHGWYLVGHGLAIDPELLRDEPLLTDVPGEDLELGYRLSYLGATVRVDYGGIDCSDVPIEVEDAIEQASRWFIGEVIAVRSSIGRHGPRLSLLLRICGLSFWLLGPPCVMAVSVGAIRDRRVITVAALGATGAIELLSFLKLNGWLSSQRLPTSRTVPGLVGYFLKPILFSLGAFRAITRYRLGRSTRAPRKARASLVQRTEGQWRA